MGGIETLLQGLYIRERAEGAMTGNVGIMSWGGKFAALE